MNQTDFDLFFENPACFRAAPGNFGILYLLRRDIDRTLGRGEGSWLGALGIFAGIDLLAKFHEGNDDFNDSGPRIKRFIEKYLGLADQSEVNAIYQLRNAMMHSFALYSRKRGGTEHWFCLVAGASASHPLIQTRHVNQHLIDVIVLHRRFEAAVEAYKVDPLADSGLQSKFAAMFSHYGQTSIGPV